VGIKVTGSHPRRFGGSKLRALVAAAVLLVCRPAAAELRIVQSGLPKPFPSIGDSVVGCHDPANTANWIDIITGKLWERKVQDGESHTLTPSLGYVATGVRGFFHSYIRTGECSSYEDGDEVTSSLTDSGMVLTWCARAIPTEVAIGSRPSICRAAITTSVPSDGVDTLRWRRPC
jgi:hypothetical protein